MTKKILGVLAVTILLLLSMAMLPTFAEEETSLGNGFTDILFSNDYRGFCLDNYKDGAYVDDKFTTTSASEATSNIDNSNISQKIKALFIVGFDELFTYDETAGYVLSDSNMVQSVIWKFTDDRYIWGAQTELYNKVNEYTGPEIPDSGYTLTLASGDTVTFYFMIMQPQKSDQQDFFAYKVVTNETPSHTHAPSEEWTTDEDSHWHECECGEKFDEEAHNPSEDWTTDEESHWHECECGEKFDEEAHTPSEDWTTDEDKHWHECECGEKFDEEAHNPSEDWTTDEESHWHECECGEKFDEEAHTPSEDWTTDEDKHWHECECGEKFDEEAHNPSEDWVTDEESHWHECECGEKFDEEAHNPSEDWVTDEESHWHECECGEKFDEEAHNPSEDWTTDEESHWHECECGEKFDEEAHNPSEDWTTDEESHWHECECGDKSDEEEHTFENGKCTVCETEDPNYEVTPPEDEEVTPPSDEEETIPPTEEDTTPPSEDKVPSPETGDCSQVYLWMMVSLIMAGAFVFKRKAIR